MSIEPASISSVSSALPATAPASTVATSTAAASTASPSAESLASLSDDELRRRLAGILRDGRRLEADLVAHIAEFDERRLFLREACSSMFVYCVERLHLSEPETALRIVVARASRRHPVLLHMLREGRLHLSGIALLAPHLTEQNRGEVLARASHLSKRQIEELVAGLAPRPDAPTLIRKLPLALALAATQHRPDDAGFDGRGPFACLAASSTGQDGPSEPAGGGAEPPADSASADSASPAGSAAPPASGRSLSRPGRPGMEPLAPSRYKIQFTASAELKDKLARLQVLMGSAVSDGDLATLIEDAVTEKIARLERRRLGGANNPRRDVAHSDARPGPRYIPAAVKRAVRLRDGDRCAYVDTEGRRCTERRGLQFHHRHPYGLGGDRSPSNIAQACRAHNLFEASVDFGEGRRRLLAGARLRAKGTS